MEAWANIGPSCDLASHVMLLVTSDLRSVWVQLQGSKCQSTWGFASVQLKKTLLCKMQLYTFTARILWRKPRRKGHCVKILLNGNFCLFNWRAKTVPGNCLPELRRKVTEVPCGCTISQNSTGNIDSCSIKRYNWN